MQSLFLRGKLFLPIFESLMFENNEFIRIYYFFTYFVVGFLQENNANSKIIH